MTNFNGKTAETIKMELLTKEKIDIMQLDLSKEAQRRGFLDALSEKASLVSKIVGSKAESFLQVALANNYALFVQLSREQYTDSLAQIYLFGRLMTDEQQVNSVGLNYISFLSTRSIDGKTVLSCSYATPEGDDISFFDNDLEIPLSLKCAAKVQIKIDDAIKLIEKLDVHVAYLGAKKIKQTLGELINRIFRDTLHEYIGKNKVGFYKLSAECGAVEAALKKKLAADLGEYGITISSALITKMAIPADMQHKLEDQAFFLRLRRAEAESDAALAKLSLESYEAKLALQAKYPGAEETLTEYEKDKALDRYLTKVGLKEAAALDHNIDMNVEEEAKDGILKKVLDLAKDKKKIFLPLYIPVFIAFIISLVILGNSLGGGLIMLGVSFLTAGAVSYYIFKQKQKISAAPTEEDSEQDSEASTDASTDASADSNGGNE